jgi:hypothetical protein
LSGGFFSVAGSLLSAIHICATKMVTATGSGNTGRLNCLEEFKENRK